MRERSKPTARTRRCCRRSSPCWRDLQGQRLAGVVVLTDGRDTPARPLAEALAALKNFGVKVYPVAVGSDKAPTNIEVQSVNVQDTRLQGRHRQRQGDRPRHRLRAGPPRHARAEGQEDRRTCSSRADGQPVEQHVTPRRRQARRGRASVQARRRRHARSASSRPRSSRARSTTQDNTRTAQVAVLDAKITVLYVDGYPRWEYRYIKNEMIRDKTVDISCLLTSADPSFAQEGDLERSFPGRSSDSPRASRR